MAEKLSVSSSNKVKRLHETDDDSDSTEIVQQQIQKKKKKKLQVFRSDYARTWPCLVASKKRGPDYAYCCVCDSDFSVGHGGANDCKRHMSGKWHKDYAASVPSQKITSMFSKVNMASHQTHTRSITNAERLICELMYENNLSLSSADKIVAKVKRLCPDSAIAKGMQCGRSKATAMIKEMSALHMKDLADQMKKNPYSLATDGSNEGEKKQFPLVIRTYQVRVDGSLGCVDSQLLAMRACDGSATGENIFTLLHDQLQSQGIPWNNCIAFGCDNAPVMTGHKKGVISFIQKEATDVYLAGCTLHLVHLGAKKGASCLPPIEEVLIDIYYFFAKSSLRQSNLKQFQQLYDVEQKKMLKHGCTRWLSISRCISRLLESWLPLTDYFKAEVEKAPVKKSSEKDDDSPKPCSSKKVESIYDFMRSPTNRLYTMFLAYTIKVYDGVLVKLQAEEPMIHQLLPSLKKLLLSLYSRFLKPVAVSGKQVTEVEYMLQYNQKTDSDLLIGDAAREFIANADKNKLRESRVKEFYLNVRKYFEATLTYLLKKLPLQDALLRHALIVDPAMQMQAKLDDLRYFINKFPCLLPQGTAPETVEEEFATYQPADVADLKARSERVDVFWAGVKQEYPDLGNLAQVMIGVCTIPHSSAACERIFSCVKKNLTDQRSTLHQDTLEALLVLKSCPEDTRDLRPEELNHLKSAYSMQQAQYKAQ